MRRCQCCSAWSAIGWAVCGDGVGRELMQDPGGSGLLVDDYHQPRLAFEQHEVSEEWVECPECSPARSSS